MAGENVVAFILIVTEIGREYEVAERIRKLGAELGVEVEAHVVYGEYDVAVRIAADSLKKIDKAVTAIRGLAGVLRTVTLIAAD